MIRGVGVALAAPETLLASLKRGFATLIVAIQPDQTGCDPLAAESEVVAVAGGGGGEKIDVPVEGLTGFVAQDLGRLETGNKPSCQPGDPLAVERQH